MGNIKCEYNWQNTGHQVWYDGTTQETLMSTHPKQFVEEWDGAAGGSVIDGTMIWNTVDVGSGSTQAIVADDDKFLLHIPVLSGACDSVLYQNDNKTFDVGNELVLEAGVTLAVAPGTGVCVVFGMAGNHNLDKDSVTEAAWFRLDASLALKVETDDTTNNNDDIDTGITLVAGVKHIYRIDFSTLSDVKFFVDGNRVAYGTTFDMSNLSASEAKMQPYFSLDKATGSGLGDMNIEYVKIFSNRD